MRIIFGVGLCLWAFFTTSAATLRPAAKQTPKDWPVYGGQSAQQHYSSLAQINRRNVKRLKVAWTFDSGETGGLETSPIVVGRVLYACTPSQKIVALNAATGKLIWKFDAGTSGKAAARGVTYWTDGHDSRIFAGILTSLYALDARTGKRITAFGENGRVDLRKELGGDYRQHDIGITSPGIVYKDLIIVGFGEPETHPAPPGDIRAYDVRTGKLRWSFHTIPRPGEFGYDSWPKDAWRDAGGANCWTGMALDHDRGVVYVPTGSAVFDFYGADRVGNDLFSDSLIALDAATGKRIWHFQGVHHDLWDRDFPAPPTLVTVQRDGRAVDAVAQTTKTGWLYLLNRTTGEPLFPIEERAYPPSHIPGEAASPTQPIPTLPLPFTRQAVTEDSLTDRTPEVHAWAVKQFRTFLSGGQYFPVSVDKLTVFMPGLGGGAEWGGSAFDPNTGVLYVNANDTAWLVGVTPTPTPGSPGERIYQNQCSVCHGPNRGGSPPAIPSLLGIDRLLTDKEIADTVHQGKGRMPAFGSLNDEQTGALLEFLKTSGLPRRASDTAAPTAAATTSAAATTARSADEKSDMPYEFMGYLRFLDPDGYPAIKPPWGTLSAIDLNTGKYLWKLPLGEYPELIAKGMRNTGSDNYGGPIITAGGVLFIGATVFDRKFRAFDSSSGDLLWETTLPFAGLATPATYMVDGKQYVVIASSGGQSNQGPSGGLYVAFALGATSKPAAHPAMHYRKKQPAGD